MKKYFSVYERKNGDSFGEEVAIDKKEDAIAEAQNHWNHLQIQKRLKRNMLVCCTVKYMEMVVL